MIFTRVFKHLKKKSSIALITFAFILVIMPVYYNSCASQQYKDILFSKMLDNFLQDFSLEINRGAISTNRADVFLTFKVPPKNVKGEKIEYEVKISRNSDCSDGKWEDHIPKKPWTLSINEEKEKVHFVYAKFREKREKNVNYIFRTEEFKENDGESECVYDTILYDSLPPRDLRLTYNPARRTNQKRAEFRFKAKDYGAVRFECQLSSSANPSNSGDSSAGGESTWGVCPSFVVYESLGEGEHFFHLRARDLSGNISDPITYSWEIDSSISSLNFSCPADSNNLVEFVEINIDKGSLGAGGSAEGNQISTFDLYCREEASSGSSFISCGTLNIAAEDRTGSLQVGKEHFIRIAQTAGGALPSSADQSGEYRLEVKAFDHYRNRLEPVACTWEVDMSSPSIRWVAKPDVSYGVSTVNNTVSPSKFKIRLERDYTGESVELRYSLKYKTSSGSSYLDIPPNGGRVISSCSPLNAECEFDVEGLIPGIGENPNEHEISVVATDRVGNKSEISHRWDVYGEVESRNSEINILQAQIIQPGHVSSGDKVNILFVVDNSGSMSPYSRKLGRSLNGIIQSFENLGLNWQIAVTLMEKDGPYFGEFSRLSGETDKYILSSKSPSHCTSNMFCLGLGVSDRLSQFQSKFAATITTPFLLFRGGKEFGIQSVNKLLDRYIRGEQAYLDFFSKDAVLVVIFIADERNCNNMSAGCSGSNTPDNLIAKVKSASAFGNQKRFFAYAIVPSTTTFDNGHFVELSKKTQGSEDPIRVDLSQTTVSGALPASCSGIANIGAYTAGLCKIGESVFALSDHLRTVNLDCKPVQTQGAPQPLEYQYSSEATHPTSTSWAPLPGGVIPNTFWGIGGANKVRFDSSTPGSQIPAGSYKVNYSCYSHVPTPPGTP